MQYNRIGLIVSFYNTKIQGSQILQRKSLKKTQNYFPSYEKWKSVLGTFDHTFLRNIFMLVNTTSSYSEYIDIVT